MRAKSKRKVEIRVNIPYRKRNNKKGIMYPGFEIEVTEVVKGQNIDGNNVWYKDSIGDFYWSGGFEETHTLSRTFEFNEYVDYNTQLIGLPDKIRVNRGNKTVIAVLDTGVFNKHSSLVGEIKEFNFIDNTEIIDKDGHGTACVSVISSYKNENFNISGIANKAEIISCKVADNRLEINTAAVLKALRFLKDRGNVDVVNMSFQIASSQAEIEINRIISEFPKTVVFVASCRNNEKLIKPYLSFPASNSEVISVGQIAKQSFVEFINKGQLLNNNIDFIMEFAPYLTAGIESVNDIDYPTGSSFSTSLISGLCALFITNLKVEGVEYDRQRIKDEIQKISDHINAESLNKKLIIFRP